MALEQIIGNASEFDDYHSDFHRNTICICGGNVRLTPLVGLLRVFVVVVRLHYSSSIEDY